jgi:hypothetical protein
LSGPACPVCDTEMSAFDTARVLGMYNVTYHRCGRCGLVAARETPWLEAAYESAIHDADVGLLRRARRSSALTSAILRFEGLRDGSFLDWAAGYGIFVEEMRERGFDFWQHDDYAKAVMAREFKDDGRDRYDLITAFEVVEHLAEPRTELAPIASRTDRLLVSTCLLPEPAPKVADWWYYMPEVGQHVTFHTVTSLRLLATELGFQLTSNGINWHLLHRGPIDVRTRVLLSSRVNHAGRAARSLSTTLRRAARRLR